jgi:hypothetical protein
MSHTDEKHIELSVVLAHDLDVGEDDNMLVINEGNHHQVFEKLKDTHHMHTITWTLTGNAINGEFCGLDEGENPGFLWLVRKPKEKIFHKLHLVGKNKLTIHNHHNDKSTEGIWHYQLFAKFCGKVYGVPLTFCCGGKSSPNPSIKNT